MFSTVAFIVLAVVVALVVIVLPLWLLSAFALDLSRDFSIPSFSLPPWVPTPGRLYRITSANIFTKFVTLFWLGGLLVLLHFLPRFFTTPRDPVPAFATLSDTMLEYIRLKPSKPSEKIRILHRAEGNGQFLVKLVSTTSDVLIFEFPYEFFHKNDFPRRLAVTKLATTSDEDLKISLPNILTLHLISGDGRTFRSVVVDYQTLDDEKPVERSVALRLDLPPCESETLAMTFADRLRNRPGMSPDHPILAPTLYSRIRSIAFITFIIVSVFLSALIIAWIIVPLVTFFRPN